MEKRCIWRKNKLLQSIYQYNEDNFSFKFWRLTGFFRIKILQVQSKRSFFNWQLLLTSMFTCIQYPYCLTAWYKAKLKSKSSSFHFIDKIAYHSTYKFTTHLMFNRLSKLVLEKTAVAAMIVFKQGWISRWRVGFWYSWYSRTT